MSKGAGVATAEEAAGFIRDFILELRNDESGRMRRHSREYDLFLPWLWEEITTSGTHLEPTHTKLETNELYMETAWELVQKGYLRPGPLKTTSEAPAGDYGKGYTLTPAGKAWIEEAQNATPEDEKVGEEDPVHKSPTQPDLDASPV